MKHFYNKIYIYYIFRCHFCFLLLLLLLLFTLSYPIQHGSTYNNIYFHQNGTNKRKNEKKNHTVKHIILHTQRTHLFHILSYFPRDELNSLLPKLNKKAVILRSNVYLLGGMFCCRILNCFFFCCQLYAISFLYFANAYPLFGAAAFFFSLHVIAWIMWYDRQLDGLSHLSICFKNNYVF